MRRWPTVAALLLGAGVLVVVQLHAVRPAAAVPGIFRVAATSARSSLSTRTVEASCPDGTGVFGGGARVDDGGARKVMLTQLNPFGRLYRAAAIEPAGGFSGTWTLTAYAICGSVPSDQMALSSFQEAPSSDTFHAAFTDCGGVGHQVLSAGGAVSVLNGRIGLHLVRPDGFLTIARVAARETAAGYSGDWAVSAHAVCILPIPGLRSVGQVVDGSTATVVCPAGTRVHGAGGGGSLSDVGPSFLQSIVPSSDLTSVRVTMTSAPPGGMVAQATCAD